MSHAVAVAAADIKGDTLRAFIYDTAILPLTSKWYAQVLQRLPDGAKLLDVGIGTGGALASNAPDVIAKKLHITGVDIDEDYVRRARVRVQRAGLGDHVDVQLVSIFDFDQVGFDAAYFSASFMLMPDPPAVLSHVKTLLAPGGKVYFTQTFETRRSPMMERAKPLLHKLTTIKFGTVTYEHEFMATVEAAGFDVVEHERLDKGRARGGRLVVVEPR